MGLAFRLKAFPEILSGMFNTARSPTRGLGKRADLNRGSFLRTTLEAAALQDAEQYAQISKLLDLFDPRTSHDEDLDRWFMVFGSFFDEDLRRLGAQTSVGAVVIGDSDLQVTESVLEDDVPASSMSFTVTPATPTFEVASGHSVFVVLVGSTALGQTERVLVSKTGDVMSIISPLSGFRYLHRAGEPVRLAAIAGQVASPATAGDTTLTVGTGTGVLFAGGSVIIDREDLVKRELKVVSSVAGDVLTLASSLGFNHDAGAYVYRSTTGSDRAIGVNTQVFVPANFGSQQVDFLTTSAGTLFDGDLETLPIDIESVRPGADTRVASGSIAFFASKPFPTAVVINPESCVRGADREKDTDYLTRGLRLLQSLSRGTPTAIESRVLGLLDPVSQKSVAYVQDVEPVGYGVSNLYITDGTTTFTVSQTAASGREVLIRAADEGDRRAHLRGQAPYGFSAAPGNITPRIFKSVDRGEATAVGANSLTDTGRLAVFTSGVVGMWLKTLDDQFYQITAFSGFGLTLDAAGATPGLGSYAIFDFSVVPLVPSILNPPDVGADYVFAPNTGDLELITALVKNDALVAADTTASTPSILGMYKQSSGLGAYVQKVVNGDKNDKQNFPGIKASGTQVFVKAPSVVSPTFVIRIEPEEGLSNAQLERPTQAATERTVNALGIGENIILSDIIVAVKAIPGMRDCGLVSPKENVSVLDGEIPRITSINVIVV